MYKVKTSMALPKDDGNGLEGDLATNIVETVLSGRQVRPRVALLVFDAGIEVKPDSTTSVTVRALQVLPVVGKDNRRQLEVMLRDEYCAQTGALSLPFELDLLLRQTFGDLPKTAEQIDEDQALQRETMTAADELRQHLRVVHGTDGTAGMTEAEARAAHDADHADGGAVLPEALRHEPGWIGWSRADLELAEIQAEEYAFAGMSDDEIDAAGDQVIPYDADGMTSGGHAGSPGESSDPDQVD
jgi:hypothetical protein